MPKAILTLSEATVLISEMNTLDNKIDSLIQLHNELAAKITSNEKEIARLEALKRDTSSLREKATSVQAEVSELNDELFAIKRKVEDGGWPVPIQKKGIVAAGSVRM